MSYRSHRPGGAVGLVTDVVSTALQLDDVTRLQLSQVRVSQHHQLLLQTNIINT